MLANTKFLCYALSVNEKMIQERRTCHAEEQTVEKYHMETENERYGGPHG